MWLASAKVVVSHGNLSGDAVAVPTTDPSSRNSTLVTPMLSDAEAETVTFPETVAPLAGLVTGVVGAVVSVGAGQSIGRSCRLMYGSYVRERARGLYMVE